MGTLDYIGDPEIHTKLLLHDFHAGMRDAVEELISRVRAASDQADLQEPQEHLLGYLLQAEENFSKAHRLVKRREGDELDLVFWRRAIGQIRSVGDAAAWKFLDYRRQHILFFGRNQPPGLMYGKQGSDIEIRAFREHWAAGRPTILGGLTSCIRIGDLLVAEGDTLTVMEVKTDVTKTNSRQRRRMELLVRQTNVDPRIDTPDGPLWIMESDVEMATHWGEAEVHVEAAMEDGYHVWAPNECVSLMFFAPFAAATRFRGALDEGEATRVRIEEEAVAVIGGEDQHKIVFNSLRYPYAAGPSATMSIFPLSPPSIARLLTGELTFIVRINVDRLADRLRSMGMDAVVALTTEQPNLRRDTPILRYRGPGDRRGIIRTGVVEEVGFELVQLDRWAQALATTPFPQGEGKRFHGHLCLANERDAWA